MKKSQLDQIILKYSILQNFEGSQEIRTIGPLFYESKKGLDFIIFSTIHKGMIENCKRYHYLIFKNNGIDLVYKNSNVIDRNVNLEIEALKILFKNYLQYLLNKI